MNYDEVDEQEAEAELEQDEKFDLLEQFWANENEGWPYPD